MGFWKPGHPENRDREWITGENSREESWV